VQLRAQLQYLGPPTLANFDRKHADFQTFLEDRD